MYVCMELFQILSSYWQRIKFGDYLHVQHDAIIMVFQCAAMFWVKVLAVMMVFFPCTSCGLQISGHVLWEIFRGVHYLFEALTIKLS